MRKPEQLHVYVSEGKEEMIKEMKALCAEYKLQPSRLVMACIEACHSTYMKEIPLKRSFKMNGRTVTP